MGIPSTMSQLSRKEYLAKMRWRYAGRGSAGKSRLLDEVCAVCDLERKYAIKLMNQKEPPARGKAGRKPVYVKEVAAVVKAIWLSSEQPCGKLLKQSLPLWLPEYERRQGVLDKALRAAVLRASAATLDRLLSPHRSAHPRRWRMPKPGTLIKSAVPVRTDNKDIDRPGYLEADTVAHCGGSLAGSFIWSVNATDIISQWTQTRAVWNKGQEGVVRAMSHIEAGLPFVLLAVDTDNGSEFLNWHMEAYLRQRPGRVAVVFTRSRPYRKNDNAHIEQKNWTEVRQLVGYDRLGSAACVAALNAVYKDWNLLRNFFSPTMKLKSKERVGSRYQKKYHAPQTPAQRLLKWQRLPAQYRQWIKQMQQQLDPFALRERIEANLHKVFQLARKDPHNEAQMPEGGAARFGVVDPSVAVSLRSTSTTGSTTPNRSAL